MDIALAAINNNVTNDKVAGHDPGNAQATTPCAPTGNYLPLRCALNWLQMWKNTDVQY